jgi:AraC-like DNA-binding protein
VEVVAHLPFPLLAHLRVVLGQRHSLTTADGWESLQELLRSRHVDVLVVDPGGPGEIRVPEVRQLRDRHPSLPIVVYTILSPPSMRAMLELARTGIEEMVLHRVEDEPRRFLALLEGLRGYVLGDLLIDQLRDPLSRLPSATAIALERLLRNPEEFASVPHMASQAGVTIRKLYRQFQRAGFVSPRVVHESARLLRAYGYLQDSRCLVEDAAARLGYSAPRHLNRQFRAATGLRGTSLRDSLSPEELVALLARRMQLNGGG